MVQISENPLVRMICVQFLLSVQAGVLCSKSACTSSGSYFTWINPRILARLQLCTARIWIKKHVIMAGVSPSYTTWIPRLLEAVDRCMKFWKIHSHGLVADRAAFLPRYRNRTINLKADRIESPHGGLSRDTVSVCPLSSPPQARAQRAWIQIQYPANSIV